MVSCYAHSCNKRSHQDSFVPFPWRDRKRAELCLWLAKCGRLPRTKQELTKFNYRGKFLCSAHFRKDDFLPDFRRTLMPSEKWIGVKVKDDALPSIFEHPHARTRPAPTPAALGHAVGSKPSTPCFPLPTTPSHKSQQDSFSMSTSPSTSTITSISPRQQRMERKERMEVCFHFTIVINNFFRFFYLPKKCLILFINSSWLILYNYKFSSSNFISKSLSI